MWTQRDLAGLTGTDQEEERTVSWHEVWGECAKPALSPASRPPWIATWLQDTPAKAGAVNARDSGARG